MNNIRISGLQNEPQRMKFGFINEGVNKSESESENSTRINAFCPRDVNTS